MSADGDTPGDFAEYRMLMLHELKRLNECTEEIKAQMGALQAAVAVLQFKSGVSLALMGLQSVRDKFGPITVNNWHAGGSFKESGMRSFSTSTGAVYSMHRYGGAYDCKSKSATPAEMCEYIIKNRHEFPMITCLENPKFTESWMHIDSRNHNLESILIVNP
jgi:hypothetical protein